MRKSSCKNTPQYLRSCCSPIGQNNTKDFSAQSGGSIGRTIWKWSGKSRFPGAFSALLVNQRRFISLSDLFPLAPANRPWVSEDGGFLNFTLHQILCFVKFHAASNFMMPTSIVRCGLVTRQENEATRFPPKLLLWFFVNINIFSSLLRPDT